jgi:hypothetical protein
MSTVTRVIMEAEAASSEQAVRQSLRAALQELARQGVLRVRTNRPAGPGEAGPAGPGVAGPARVGGAGSSGGVGAPIANNSPGRPDVRVVGRSPQPAKPIRRSMKSRIVPEPDQVQSEPASRRSTLLEPPGF